MSDEKIRLVLETLGVDNVRQATKALKEFDKAVDDVDDSIKTGLIASTGEFFITLKDGQRVLANTAEGFRKLIDDEGRFLITLEDGQRVWNDSAIGIRSMNEALQKYQDNLRPTITRTTQLMDSHVQMHRKVQEEQEKSAKATAAFGRRMLEASYAIDDIQYGFHGIVNNIPRFAQAFNISAAAVGAISIAAVGVNQAFKLMNSLLGDAEIKVKPLGEAVGDFAKGLGASAVEAERLTQEVKKLSTQSMAGWTTGLTENLGKIREAIQAQKEIVALQKESQEAAEKRDAFEKRVAEAGKIKDKGGQLGDVLEGVGPDGMVGLAQKLAPDKLGKARGQLMDEQLAAMEAAGNFGDIRDPLFGFAMPFLNRGGTGLTKSRAEERAAARRADAKRKLESSMSFDSEETRKKAESIAGETIEKAVAGDPQAIAEIEAISPEFSDLIKWDAADKEFQSGLESRSRAVASRNATRAKAKAASMEMASNPQIDPLLLAERQAQEAAAAGMLPNRAMFDAEQSRQALQNQAAHEAAQARNADIRNSVLGMMDPAKMAAMRVLQANQMGDPRKVMPMLERRDMQMFSQALMTGGMNQVDAEAATIESLSGGKNQLSEFLQQVEQTTGKNINTTQAAVLLLQKFQADQQRAQAQIDELQNQILMLNQANIAPARPQNGHARQ